jgi:excisionase family DNA binding protein
VGLLALRDDEHAEGRRVRAMRVARSAERPGGRGRVPGAACAVDSGEGRPDVSTELDVLAVVTVPRLLSVATVAHVLDCSTRTVRRRIHDGRLPAVVEGERIMVRGDDLQRYIDSLTSIERAGQRRRPRPMASDYDFLT